MSTKPSTLPRWASTGGAAIVTPSSGVQDVGWIPGLRPRAQYENWRAKLSYQWLQYLSDGAFQGPHSFDDMVSIDGGIKVTAFDYYDELGRTYAIPYNLATPDNDADFDRLSANPMWGILGSATSKLRYPLTPLREGDRILSVGVLYEKGSDTGTTLNMRLVKSRGGTGGTDGYDVVATHAGAAFNAPGHSQMTLSASDEDVAQYVSYFIEVWSTTGSNLDGFGSAYFTKSHPTP